MGFFHQGAHASLMEVELGRTCERLLILRQGIASMRQFADCESYDILRRLECGNSLLMAHMLKTNVIHLKFKTGNLLTKYFSNFLLAILNKY